MEFIDIKKKRYAFSFNMAAFLEIEKWTGLPVSQVFSEEGMESSTFTKLLYLGLKYGADEMRNKFDLTYSAFIDMVAMDEAIMTELGRLFTEDYKIILALFEEKAKLSLEGIADDKKKEMKQSGLTTSDVSAVSDGDQKTSGEQLSLKSSEQLLETITHT